MFVALNKNVLCGSLGNKNGLENYWQLLKNKILTVDLRFKLQLRRSSDASCCFSLNSTALF